jgi:YaiO family outer membrane protein
MDRIACAYFGFRISNFEFRTFRSWCLLLSVLSVCTGLLTAQPAPTPNDVRRALHFRQFDRAIELADFGLTEHPGDPSWRLAQVNILVARGQLTTALAEARTILKDHPQHRGARVREAQLLGQLGRLTSAAAAYHSCLNDFPDDADVMLGLGLVHMWQGRFAEADPWLEKAALQRTTRETSLYARLRLLTASGRLEQAWRESTELDTHGNFQDAELGLLRAGLISRIGARESAQTLAARPSKDPELRRRQAAFLARMSAHHGLAEAPMAEVEAFAALDPPDYDALLAAADVFAAADHRAEARRLYRLAAQLTPERPEAWLGLARLASRDGRLSGAMGIYQQILRDNEESLEAWLGMVRAAQLMDDADTAQLALARAHALAPGSAYVLREELHQALLDGDLNRFRERLKWYLEAQPDDREALLWRLRLQVLDGSATEERDYLALLDPLSPRGSALVVRHGLVRGFRLDEWLIRLSTLGDPELNLSARTALATQLALLVQPDAAKTVAAAGRPDMQAWLNALSEGWWAFASTPFAHGRELEQDFDPQALAVWLADELQHRFRSLYVETESSIWEAWLLLRAHWFESWAGRWDDPAASAALVSSLRQVGARWTSPPSLNQVQAAWDTSDTPLPGGATTYLTQITRARWRLYRHDPDGALSLLRQAQRLEPRAAEPIQRQAEALRAAGRLREAARVLQSLCRNPDVDPGSRLKYADLLRRLGRPDEARLQLHQLRESGVDEPDIYLQEAFIAEAEGRSDEAGRWYRLGRQRHPRAATLYGQYNRWLLRQHREDLLAETLMQPKLPPWTDAEQVAPVASELSATRRQALLSSPRWWFSWNWLGWIRLPTRSAVVLQARANDRVAHAAVEDALEVLHPALDARLPDSELWLQGARLFDLNRRFADSERAFRFAMHLGCGRLDADVLRLSREAYRDPQRAARDFARRLEVSPDQRPLRIGLVHSLLQAGEIGAAERALIPLVEEDPDDLETRMLAAQLKAAQGEVRQARSLHESLLRQDPLAADPRAARRALNERNELGGAIGYEHQMRRDTTGMVDDIDDWREAFVSAFWRRPHSVTTSLEYRSYERSRDSDHQLFATIAAEVDPSWIVRARGAVGFDTDYTSRYRLGGGANRELTHTLYANFDVNYLRFTDLDVWQLVPAVVWRWHPRGTAEGRVYVGFNQLDSGPDETSLTGLVNLSWQLGRQSLLIAHGAWGDENAANPTSDLIGNDSFKSYGLRARFGWRDRWHVEPAYRYDRHEQFDLHALGISLGYSY